MNKKLKNLNEILIDIINNNKNRYQDLLNHEYIDNTIGGTVASFFKKTKLDYNDIYSEAKTIILCELISSFEIRNKDDVGKMFLDYLKKILGNKLITNYKKIDFSEESTTSLESLGVPPEVVDEELFTKEDFSDDLIFGMDLYNYCISNLSNREKQVFFMIYKEDLTQQEIADRLGISQGTVFEYKKRIRKKIENYVCN